MTKTILLTTTAVLLTTGAAAAQTPPPAPAPQAEASQQGALVFTPEFFAGPPDRLRREPLHRPAHLRVVPDPQDLLSRAGMVGSLSTWRG